MYKVLIFVICICSIGLLSSCSGTHTLGTWEKKGLQPSTYSKLVVFTNAPTIAARGTLERVVASKFANKRMDAVAASDDFPKMGMDTSTKISDLQPILSSGDADLLLIIFVGKTAHSFKQKSKSAAVPTTVTKCESKLFNVKTGELLMTVDTESELSRDGVLNNFDGYEDYEDLANELGSELVSNFKNKAIAY